MFLLRSIIIFFIVLSQKMNSGILSCLDLTALMSDDFIKEKNSLFVK